MSYQMQDSGFNQNSLAHFVDNVFQQIIAANEKYIVVITNLPSQNIYIKVTLKFLLYFFLPIPLN